ncbi:unnamed protein product [Heterobilharzia americana]|nr:unnamed protein product [Heterobilharzia americana]CAH8595151.1 unnamed protein product [Heterobilharzia americana]
MNKPKRIVCIPVDGSDHSMRALEWYIKEVHRPGDEVIFVHVIEMPNLPLVKLSSGLRVPVDNWTKSLQENIDRSTELNNKYGYICEKNKITYDFVVMNGSAPGPGIIHAAETYKVDLIIMGCRGLGKVQRTLIGSVSDHVVHNTHVTCITVPPNE